MSRSIILLVLLLFSFQNSSVDAHVFSRASRNEDVSLLERLTLPFRRTLRLPFSPVDSLVDFLASNRGLLFLAFHVETLWYQELLEREYDRPALCQNMQHGELTHGTLSARQRRLRDCLCSPYLPFLHCLAIGTQLLRESGYANGDISDKILTHETLPLTDNGLQNLDKKNTSHCIPKLEVVGDELVFDGFCDIPIAKLITIKLKERISLGVDAWFFLNTDRCCICRGLGDERCVPFCDQTIRVAEDMVDKTKAQLDTDICIDLGAIGDLISLIFGIDKCISGIDVELFPYQRLLRLNAYFGVSSWRTRIDLDYKFDDGPHCVCQLSTFRCTDYCSMKGEEVAGDLGIEWELFFGGGKLMRNFNDQRSCYTHHIHGPPDCDPNLCAPESSPASPDSPVWSESYPPS